MEHSKQFNIVKKWYDKGLWKIEAVVAAVKKGWITPEEYEEITGEKYVV